MLLSRSRPGDNYVCINNRKYDKTMPRLQESCSNLKLVIWFDIKSAASRYQKCQQTLKKGGVVNCKTRPRQFLIFVNFYFSILVTH